MQKQYILRENVIKEMYNKNIINKEQIFDSANQKSYNQVDFSQQLIDLCLDFGNLMLESGAESSRVEDSIVRILKSYNRKSASAFAIPTLLLISFKNDNDEIITTSKRVSYIHNDFYKLDQLSNLSYEICNNENISLEFFQKSLQHIKVSSEYRPFTTIFSTIIVSLGFIYIFRGSLRDVIGAILTAIVMRSTFDFLSRKRLNSLFINLISSFLGGIVSEILFSINIVDNPSIIIVSTFMNFVPGIMITNAIRDYTRGDYTSGTNKLIEALLIAISLAIGSVFARILLRG